MKLTYLGTAAAEGFPAVFCNCAYCNEARTLGGKNIRTRSQALINEDLLIDLPADTYFHFLQNGIRGDQIAYLLVTHAHSDHFYPAELESARDFLLVGSLAQVIFFTTSFVTVILIRFASKACQVIVNGVFGVCFFGIGIPATLWKGLWGFAVAMVIANVIRWLVAIVLGWYTASRKGIERTRF